jgi:hypothetical protein
MVINIRIITDENTAFDLAINEAVAYVLDRLSNQVMESDAIRPGLVMILEDSYRDRCGFMTVER